MDVWIDAAPQRTARQSMVDPLAPFGDDDPFAPRQATPLSSVAPFADPAGASELDPLQFFEPVAGRTPAREPEPVLLPVDDLLGAHYEPPAALSNRTPAKPDSAGIPQGYDPLAADDSFVESVTPAIHSRPVVERPSPRRKEKSASSAKLPSIRQPAPPIVSPARTASEVVFPELPTPAPEHQAPREPGKAADLAELLVGAGMPSAVVTP